MKSQELRQKTEQGLQELLSEKREALRNFHFNLGSGKVKNTKESRELRKDVARILTVLREKINR